MFSLPDPVPAGERAFLVARQGVEVVVREVKPGSSLVEFTRSAAMEHARRMAKPSKLAQGNAKLACPILFMALDGSRREVEAAPVPEQKAKPVYPYTITLEIRKTKVRHTVEVEAENKTAALAEARGQFLDATTLVACERGEIAPCVPTPQVPNREPRPGASSPSPAPANTQARPAPVTTFPWE